MNCAGRTCTPTAKKAVLNASDLESYLSQFGNVRVMTTGSGVEANNIVVKSVLATPDSTSLTLDAVGAITVEAPVSIGSGTAELQLQSGANGTLGDLSFGPEGNISFASTSDLFNINGADFQLEASLPDLAAKANSNPGGFYALTNSYDASADGVYHSPPISSTFTGDLEALGNTISNLTIKADTGEYIGLFAHLWGNNGFGAVRNLRLANAAVKSNHAADIGGIAGFAEQGATISQATVTGEVRSGDSSSAGGIAGFINSGTVSTSWSSAKVVVGNAFASAGGLIGSFGTGTLQNSYAAGPVEGGDDSSTGGLIGFNGSSITFSFATGAVHAGAYASAGGLVGYNGGSVENSYAEGNVSDESVGGALGGLVGYDAATDGAVASYSIGNVTGVSGDIGGVVGFDCTGGGDECNGGAYSDTYWDTTTSGLSQGAGNIRNDLGLKGLTSHKLRSGLPQGFSKKVWAERGQTNHGFPYLIDNPPPK
jgi:hypothetical protein